jgi:hypothetical protein
MAEALPGHEGAQVGGGESAVLKICEIAMAVSLCAAGCDVAHSQASPIVDSFTGPNGLVAAEGHPAADSPWAVTSGSLFRDDGVGWTGIPDGGGSAGDTGSADYRMVSVERGFADVDVTMRLMVVGLSETSRTPAQPYDGAHIWVRYVSDRELYAVSVDRRDATMIIKKKCPGGSENGGTYFDLDSVVSDTPIPFGQWQQIVLSVRDLPDGSVSISASRDGRSVQAIDRGVGCPPLHGDGGVGLRGDNAELRIDDIRVVAAS